MPRSKLKGLQENVLGKQVRVCGVVIDREQAVICSLPPDRHSETPHKVHAAVIINVELEIGIVYMKEGEEPVWQGVVDPDE